MKALMSKRVNHYGVNNQHNHGGLISSLMFEEISTLAMNEIFI